MVLYRRSDAGMLRTAWELSAGLLSFVIAVVLGWWIGRTLDSWTGTSPWLAIVFTGFGLAAGALNVYRALRHALAAAGGNGPSRAPKQPPTGSAGSHG